ncbi:MAG: hypothetical protein U5R14_07810 [Gemmatimonadota bacterium]|nr:hypothetical protein [Gemmatimonadota bacterium]
MQVRISRTDRGWVGTRAIAVLAAGLGIGLGCADRSTPDFEGRPADAPPIVVRVQNQHFSDVRVHVSRNGQWRRLGNVTGNTSSSFEVPSALTSPAGHYQFRVHAIGMSDASDYVSDRIPANPGNVIELTVASVLRMSSWSIRE